MKIFLLFILLMMQEMVYIAKATAAIFNGKITDINISSFGSGYSVTNPPTVVIQSPPEAKHL